MNNFSVQFYSKPDGTEPVKNFIYSLPEKIIAKVLREIDLLEIAGNELKQPYSKHLDDGIFELRIKQGNDISRILYFFKIGKEIILTNGFVKKTQKTPKKEIELAKKYRTEFLSRERMM